MEVFPLTTLARNPIRRHCVSPFTVAFQPAKPTGPASNFFSNPQYRNIEKLEPNAEDPVYSGSFVSIPLADRHRSAVTGEPGLSGSNPEPVPGAEHLAHYFIKPNLSRGSAVPVTSYS